MRYLVILALLLLPMRVSAETLLMMVRQDGCAYCEAWEAQIGPIYPKTQESRLAPLARVEFRAIPDDVALKRPVVFTPTFVLLRDGMETGRIEGYPGEDFFWALLGRLLEDLPSSPTIDG
ncbi:hypothetical protein [Alloyangia pacifica]|uniref:hypothetical protein n=1 Tax=Alloyangia pacifica TaxID=311180 RepID=UPI001CD6A325|nr:hypothetical protein [Alloyangia pacifica]MCA0996546.1 hypothetical protein [Alloyangia pacifica]